jgi:hypothetical protein
MTRAPHFILTAMLVVAAVAAGPVRCHAADLPIPLRYQHLIKPPPEPPPRSESLQMHGVTPQTAVPQEKNTSSGIDPIPSPKPPAPVVQAPPKRPAAPVVVAPPLQHVPATNVVADKKSAETPKGSSTFLSFLAELGTFALGFIAALIGLVALPSILRGFDAVLASPLECDVGDVPPDRGAHASGVDIQDFAQSELSAADIRRQTEVLRALKETLDAELESVRATVRRERARAEAEDKP